MGELDLLMQECQYLSDRVAHWCKLYSVCIISTDDPERFKLGMRAIQADFAELAAKINLLHLSYPQGIDARCVH